MKKKKIRLAILLLLVLQIISLNGSAQGMGLKSPLSLRDKLGGMTYTAKIDYRPDCYLGSPLVRATIRDVEVVSFTYEGETYYRDAIKDVSFPIKIKTGYLKIHVSGITGFYTKSDFNTTYLSLGLGGEGHAVMADAFKYTDQSLEILKNLYKICEEWKPEFSYLQYPVVEEGNFEYKNNGKLELYLISLIKKQKKEEMEEEAFNKQIELLDAYTKEKQPIEYYDQGIRKANLLFDKAKTEDQKSVIKSKIEDIERNKDAKSMAMDEALNELKHYGFDQNRPEGYFDEGLEKLNALSTNGASPEQLKELSELIQKVTLLRDEDVTYKKFQSLSSYTRYSNKHSSEFYKQGLVEANKIRATLKGVSETAEFNQMVESIESSLAQAIKTEVAKEMLAEEIERDKKKAEEDKKKLTRLSPEELARINQQIAYNKRVTNLSSKGFDKQQAHKMAQQEFKNEGVNKVVGDGLNQISNLVMDGINRSYERKEALRNEMYSYNSNLKNYAKTLRKSNLDYVAQLEKDMPLFTNSSENINDLKQEILWIIENLGNTKFAYENKHVYGQRDFDWGSGVKGTEDLSYKAILFIEQKIEDVYFKGNTLHIKFKQVAKEATFDKADQLGYGGTVWQPSKFELTSIVQYNCEDKSTTIQRKCTWIGKGSLPATGYLSSSDFWEQRNRIDGKYLAKPFGSEGQGSLDWDSGTDFGIATYDDTGALRNKLNKLNLLVIKEGVATNIADKVFIADFNKKVKEDYEKSKQWHYYLPLLLTNNYTNATSNPNEIAIICLLENENANFGNYIKFIFPSKELVNSISKNERGNIYPSDSKGFVSTTINGHAENFRMSYNHSEVSIGGPTGNDLLLTGEHPLELEKYIYSYHSKNQLVKDLALDAKFNPNLWNPYIEVGSFEKIVEMDYITDISFKEKLVKSGYKDANIYDYRIAPTTGVIYKFTSNRIAMLIPNEKIKYSYQGKIKGKINSNNQVRKGEFLHFKPTQIVAGYLGIKLYGVYETTYLFENLKPYTPLKYVSGAYFSKQLLDADYKYMFKHEIGKTRNAPQSGQESYNTNFLKMFEQLSSIDYSPTALKHNGKTPTYYPNGKLKTLGATVKNIKYGEWEQYNENGILETIFGYGTSSSMGKEKLYSVKKYDPKGNCISIEIIDFLGIISSIEHFDVENGIKKIIYFEDGLKSSEEVHKAKSIDDENAIKIETRKFEDGLLIKTEKHN